MPRVCAVLDRVLAHADAGQAGLIEGRVVGTTEVATPGRDCSHYSIAFKGLKDLSHDVGSFRRTEHTRPADAPRS